MSTSIRFLFFCLFLCVTNGESTCGYESCHPVKEDEINIHVVAHTHDDMGWLKTVDQYYYGTHKDIYSAGVKFILDSMVIALQENSDRRFIYVESGFFFKWWQQQNEETQNIVKGLVDNGQLEFVSGGWSMNDEATTYYQTIIDQMSLGLRKLNETFGKCGRPKVGWQIDPFGHSREMASIFAQLGFDGFFLNRIDYQDLDNRKLNRSMEFVWRGSPDNLGESTDIYTNVLFRHYSAPSGLCFDLLCNDDNIVDDISSPEYNVKQKAEDFINNWVVPASKVYASNNVLVPFGDDFNYQYAQQYFGNLDKLIKYINERKTFNDVNYNIIYSTPSCYLNAVYQATNGTLDAPLKTDDFFPYASSAHTYWTGYYTSRPTGKGYSRDTNNFLQICKQLKALTNITSDETELDVLREALAVFQHHDAITGTEKEHVSHDYIKLMHNGRVKCEEVADQILFNLVNATDMTFTTCPMLNISECTRTENEEKLIITVYNPLGRSVNKHIRIPVVDKTTEYIIKDSSGSPVLTQILPIAPPVFKIPGRNSSAEFQLIFLAENLPPLGFKSYFFEKSANLRYEPNLETVQQINTNGFTKTKLTSSGPIITSGPDKSAWIIVMMGYLYYTGFVGNDSSDEFTTSNQYIFRPDPNIPAQVVNQSAEFKLYQGPLVTESHWYYTDWFSFVLTDYHNTGKVTEYNYLVGPLPDNDNKGMEVTAVFYTDLVYDDTIHMDTNGRETIQRTRNSRPTWDVNISEPISGNYYPVVSGITVINATKTGSVTVLTDRANGGASIDYQYFELMIHRNTIRTLGDAKEPLDNGVVTRGSHYLMFGGTEHGYKEDLTPKEISQEIYLSPWIFFASPNGLSFDEYQENHIMEFSGLNNGTLPRNVHILTLEPWGNLTLLLRLENFVGKEDEWHSGTSTVNIKDLFSAFDVLTLKESTLGGNQWLEDNERILFNKQGDSTEKKTTQDENDFDVTLEPMQIRTFVLTVAYK